MILVVDDDKVLTQLLKRLLEDSGYSVLVANNGEEAYHEMKGPGCECVLLDIRMPGISGAELLMLMAAERVSVPVIVLSGFPDYDEKEMKEFANVKRFYHKPLYPEEILQAVREVIAEARHA